MSATAMSSTEKGQILTTQLLGRPDPASVSISRVEYDSLLRTAREYEILRNALLQGGVTEDTLDLLISNATGVDHRKDSGISINSWTKDKNNGNLSNDHNSNSHFALVGGKGQPSASNADSGIAHYQNGPSRTHLRVPALQCHASYGMSSGGADENGFDYDDDYDEGTQNYVVPGANYYPTTNEKRTLYFHGLSDRTTYRDLLAVIKGGKLLSITLRPERSATVTFLEGAADFLAWAKREDIYLQSKRIEVKWADRQFHLHNHIGNKIANGATRNLVIRSAVEKGLLEPQIRDDMEHIHNLVIVDVQFRNGDAYVSMNSIHNALFARTCMMSRKEYKGCKIEFYPDECDIPLPEPKRTYVRNVSTQPEPLKKKQLTMNRFDLLNIDSTEESSDEENRTPSDDYTDDDTIDERDERAGVNLRFLDSEST